ncbi:Protein VTS1 [Colletotrichum orbiculare MAFF 240422]|uniref:RNA-binding protein VTS1 n=1 Tax=Colletotrichum orbiculare (strain 104-T / ATCC 96160 / CBS 514.97 / LARS 414 / MAFF 240422) TaxID=1213857 RepID=A0A484FZB6_COLOR|nr:Protein VTS1 [Colletotrichum orbiculare MAFF 240422]
MPGSHVAGNRNSTPEANTTSSLRPPSSRAAPANSHLRASADMAALSNSSPSSRIRPSSDFYGQSQQGQGHGNSDTDPQDKIAQDWIADIDQYETTLEEMAAATLDQDFKDELSAIEQWFRVLSEAERTAALYALLQQTTQVQIRFFIQVLQQMGKNHPMSGVLSPANFDKDPMSNRLSDAMSKLSVEPVRNSLARPPSAATGKRQSGLDPSTINAMFPDAAAAIATEKAKFTQQTVARGPDYRDSRDKPADLPLLSPYNPSGGNWASMVNTPLVANFNANASGTQADMVANATAMKLAALSTVNNRFALDDVRKYRRARSNDAPGAANQPGLQNAQGVNVSGANVVMINEHGQVLSREQMLALQAQSMGFSQHRSRPSSPGIAMQSAFGAMGFASPQNNGFLSAYDGSSPLLNSGIPPVNVGQLGIGSHEGYLSDHSDMDIPSWLRSLRLHKYTENLKDMKWHELIELDDKALEERGVNALGARRKMLKVFEQVKEAKAEGKIG